VLLKQTKQNHAAKLARALPAKRALAKAANAELKAKKDSARLVRSALLPQKLLKRNNR
jgi:hypothetical protein